MKLFLIWPEKPGNLDLRILTRALEEHGHEILYFVGHERTDAAKAPHAIFHLHDDAVRVVSAEAVDATFFSPPEEELILRLHHVESTTLTMMNRSFDERSVDDRKDIYYKMLRYWRGLLEKLRPDAIIFPDMPHFGYDYVLYELAHLLGIRTIFFDDTRFPGRVLLLHELKEGSLRLRARILANKGRQFDVSHLSEDIRSYYEPRVGRGFTQTPAYITDQKKKYSFVYRLLREPSIRKSVLNASFLWKGPRYIVSVLRKKTLRSWFASISFPFISDLKKEYRKLQTDFNPSGQFVYMPLQKQPERTTSPQGGVFADQILAIETLSAALPEGWVIYAKEHPMQWLHFGTRFSSTRYCGYYERIARIRNVKIISPNTSSYELINGSEAVAAVTGSAGWEAVLRSKPAILFGTVWYEACPGVTVVKSVGDCRKAFEKVIFGSPIDQKDIINYLKSLDEATIHAYISSTAGKASRIRKEECMRNIAEALIKELTSLK
ncbi:MAG: hypothetical protein Q7R93_03295 [bacterium]|nr:hypothetical protein [bacterium]